MGEAAIDPALVGKLELVEEGLWRAPGSAAVSYPAEVHDDLFAVEDASFWFRHRNVCVTAVVRRFPPAEYIVDVGGGNGVVALALQAAGFRVVLLEPGAAAVANARRRGIRCVLHTTFEEAALGEASIDSVGLFDVLEHIEDDEAFLASLVRTMRDQARLYVTVPAHPWLWSAVDDYSGHFRRYSGPTLSDVLGRGGFELLFLSHFFSWLSLPIFLFRSLPSRLRRSPSATRTETVAPHARRPGLLSRLTDWHWGREARKLQAGSLSHGASLIAVARPRR